MTPLSIAEINAAIVAQVEIEIGQAVPLLPVAFVRVLAKAFAGVIVLIYKYTGFVFLQLFVATASSRDTTIGGVTLNPLVEWGRLVGAGDPVPAVAAELTVEITVINITGDPISSGTSLVYDPTGVIYVTISTILRDAATKLVNVVAVSDQTGGGGLGAVGNLPVDALVSFTSPLADVARDTVVTVLVTSGEDAEELDTIYRQRVIDRFQKRPQGGALADYEIWGEEAAGIINVYPYTGDLPGTVEVYCEADPTSSGSPDGFPTQPQLDAAAALIDLDVNGRATRRPANAFIFTRSITRRSFEVEVRGAEGPDLPAMKLAIDEGMITLFAKFEPFIGGLTITPLDRVTQTEVGGVVQDIARANGGTISSVLLKAEPNLTTIFSALVTASSDDASQTGSTMSLVGTTLAFIPANTIGMRFVNVNVPVNAVVSSATITFTGQTFKTPTSSITVHGEADPDPGTYTVTANDLTDRLQTVNSTTLAPHAWAIDEEVPIDVTEIVREILTFDGWAALNAMAFVIVSATGTDRDIRSYDDDPTKSPRLTVTFTAPGGTPVVQEVVTLAKGEKAKIIGVTYP